MKRISRFLVASLSACLMVAVSMAPAAAADHPCSFTTDNNKVFSIEAKLTVEFEPGYVKVKMPVTASVEWFYDATGATTNKIKASQCFQQRYAQVTADKFFNVTQSSSVACFTSGTVVGWYNTGSTNDYADGCAGHASAKAKAN